MSEASKVWRVDVDGTEHEIELVHTLMNKRTIIVDGNVVEQKRSWGAGGKPHHFDVAGKQARIKLEIKYFGFAYGSTLHVNERYVEPLNR